MSGNVEWLIGPEGNRVLIVFKAPVKTILLDLDDAMNIAENIADNVSKVRGDEHIPGQHMGKALKDEQIERHRMTTTQRGVIFLNNMRYDKKITNDQLAQSMIDMVLREVF